MTARETVATVTAAMAADETGDVVWAGEFEGRLGLRMRQRVRDFTTIWFDVGQRTMRVEAYVLPSPPRRREEVFRLALARNATTRRMRFSLDRQGDLVLAATVPVAEVTDEEIELVVGEIYELVEVSFPGLVRIGFGREKKPSK